MKEDENNAEDQTVLRKRDVNEPARKEDGMSTSLLVKKMEEAAKEKGKEVDIKAYPILDMERLIGEADVALLGPQVGYQLAKSKEICGAAGVPVDVIPMADYGMCNGMNVLRFAFKLAAEVSERK